jgi:AraC-like DNA-binding protein
LDNAPVQHAHQFLIEERTSRAAEALILPIPEPMVRAGVLAALPQYLTARGIDIGPLLTQAGLAPNVTEEPEQPIPLNATGRLFELTSRRLGDPVFGLSYALDFPPGASGLLGQLMLTAPTVRGFFNVVANYLQMHTTQLQPRFDLHPGGIGLFAFAWPASFTEPQQQFTDFYLGILVLRLRRATGPTWVPLSAEFQHREAEILEPYYKLFGTRLKFNQRQNSIAVDASILAKPMPGIPPEIQRRILPDIHKSMMKLGDQELEERSTAADVTSRMRNILTERLANEQRFDLDAVAEAMDLQPRGLQWRLEQEETTYEKILLQIRIDKARKYLHESDHQLTKIASLLGFSELSAFTRWCGKQFHMTPSAYRRHLRKGGDPVPSSADDAP